MKRTKNSIINNKSWKILLPFAAVIFLLNLSFEWAEFRGFLQIKEVNIVENSMFNNDYLADIYADSSKSIVSINVKELTDQLESNPFIKAVRISKKYPRKIEVNIVEREPIAIINNSTKILIDEDAIVMPSNHYAQTALIPMLSGFNPADDLYPEGEGTFSIKVKEAVNILKLIKTNYYQLFDEISELTINKNDEYEIILSEQPTRVILGKEDISKKIQILTKFSKALGQRELTDYRLLDMRYSKQLVAMEWT